MRWRWPVTLAAGLGALPYLAWATDPTRYLLPSTPGPLTPARLLAVTTRTASMPGDGFYLAVLGVIVLTALAAIALGLALTWRGRATPASDLLAGFLVGGAGIMGLAYFTIPFGIPGPYDRILSLPGPAAWPLVAAGAGVAFMALLRFALVFPRAIEDDVRVRPVAVRSARRAAGLRRLLRFLRSPWSWVAAAALPGVAALADLETGIIVLIWVALFALGGTYFLLDLARRAVTRQERDRVEWVFVGFSAGVWALVLLGVLPFALGPALGAAGYELYVVLFLGAGPPVVALILVLALGTAIFVGGALDPALAMKRTTLYGLLGTVYVGAFGALENLLSVWLETRLGLSGVVSALAVGGPLAVLMVPLHNRLGPLIDRRIERRRTDDHEGMASARELDEPASERAEAT